MLEDCVPWEDTQRHIRGSAERRGLPGGAVLGDWLMGRSCDKVSYIGEQKWLQKSQPLSFELRKLCLRSMREGRPTASPEGQAPA